jgi:dienelactone hydrolase
MRPFRHFAARLALLPLLIAAPASGEEHPYGLEDLLAAQAINRAVIPDHGRFVVFEWLGPYGEMINPGSLNPTEMKFVAQAKLHIAFTGGHIEARPLFHQTPSDGYWLAVDALSPDQDKIAYYTLSGTRLRAGVYELSTGRRYELPQTPIYSALNQGPIWLSSTELVYLVSDGDEPAPVSGRPAIVERVNALWQRADHGQLPSATTLSSRRSGRGDPDSVRTGRLVRFNLITGQTRPLADGYYYDLKVSPDGRWLSALREGPVDQPPPGNPPLGGWLAARKSLVVLDLLDRRPAQVACHECDVLPGSAAWSPDNILTFLAKPIAADPREAGLFQFNPSANTLRLRSLSGVTLGCGLLYPRGRIAPMSDDRLVVFGYETAYASFPVWARGQCDAIDAQTGSWYHIDQNDGRRPLEITSPSAAGWERRADGSILLNAGERLWNVPDTGGRAAAISGTAGWRFVPLTEPDSVTYEVTWFGRRERMPTMLEDERRRVRADVQGPTRGITPPAPDSRFIAMSPSGTAAVFQSNSGSGSTLFIGQEGHRPTPVLHFNRHVTSIAAAKRVSVSFRAPNSQQLRAEILMPPNWSPGTPVPLVVDVYPRRTRARSSPLWSREPTHSELLPGHGIAVMFVPMPRELTANDDGPELAAAALVEAAVDAAVAAGYADRERVGLIGFSDGFHLALQILTQTEIFSAAVVGFGVSNVSSHFGQIPFFSLISPEPPMIGSAYEYSANARAPGSTPWQAPERYVANSPVFRADRISTPLMVMSSDFDIFPLAQAQEIFTALHRQRREAELITYWGEGHIWMGPTNLVDMWSRIFGWFDRHLRERSFEVTLQHDKEE